MWGYVLRRWFNVPTLDYALLGRWIGHFAKGRFFHQRIGASAPVRGERPLGWLAHYMVGVTFAFLLLGTCGLDWAHSPTIAPPMLVGLATIYAVARATPPRRRLPVLAGIFGACLPDVDKPSHLFFGRSPFPRWFDRVHLAIQPEASHRMPIELATAAPTAIGMPPPIAPILPFQRTGFGRSRNPSRIHWQNSPPSRTCGPPEA